MSEKAEKARAAEELLDNAVLKAVFQSIKEDACNAFLSPAVSSEEVMAARQRAQAVDIVKAAIQSVIDAAALERKRQDRGND